jgi:hypothetical protein
LSESCHLIVPKSDRPEALRTMTKDKSPDQRPQPPGAPKRIGALISQLMARRGYAQVFAAEGLQAVLEAEVGPAIATAVKVGNI